jgi:pimeloyl-ACP methyl ester carboxylesterase
MFARLKASQAPNYENRATLASTEMLLQYSVLPYVERILAIPTLMVLAEGDDHTHWDLAMKAFQRISNDSKRIYVLPGSTHHTIYEDNEHLRAVADECRDWFSTHLLKGTTVEK